MSYLVLARKYRPRDFAGLVGQEHVVQALANALAQQRLHHAYLFTGTRGVGKTTVSRILAKALNCTGPDGKGGITAEPCGVCSACRDIDAGRHVDYVELDAASNRGVEEIGGLLEQAVYKPVVGRFKVYMIDEVHMLSNHAFNAMLKTLEEPPDYLKFVLATTDPQKVPPTVLSRCLQFNLRPMALHTLEAHLADVLGRESIPAEPGALRLLARAARGSMRDALSLADQAIAYGAGALAEEGVRRMLGAVDRGHAVRLVEALARRDGRAVIEGVDGLRSLGLSAAGTLEEMAALLQQMAVAQAVPDALDRADPDAPQALRLAALLPPDETQLLYGIVLHGRAELGLAPDEYAGLVMVLLRLLAFAPGQVQVQVQVQGQAPGQEQEQEREQAQVPGQVQPHVQGQGQEERQAAAPAQPQPQAQAGKGEEVRAASTAQEMPMAAAAAAAESRSPSGGNGGGSSAAALPGRPTAATPAAGMPVSAPTSAASAATAAVPAVSAVTTPGSAATGAPERAPVPVPATAAALRPVQGAAQASPGSAVPVPASASASTLTSASAAASSSFTGKAFAPASSARLPAASSAAVSTVSVSVAERGASSRFAATEAAPALPEPPSWVVDVPPPDAEEEPGAGRRWPAANDASAADEILSAAVGGVLPEATAAAADMPATAADTPATAAALADVPAAAVAAAAAVQLPTHDMALGDRWEAVVCALVEAGRVSALTRELALQAQCLSVDELAQAGPDAPCVWRLRVERDALRSATPRDRLQAALSEFLGRAVLLELEPGPVADTPARRQLAERERRQREAEQALHDDPLVRSLLRQYPSARIVPGSIRPE